VQQLKEALWQAAFPDAALDAGSSLGDVFEVAVRNAGNATRQVLEARLSVSRAPANCKEGSVKDERGRR